MDKNVNVIYNKLENIKFDNKGYVDLNDSIIQDEKDLVNLCNVFRDPRYETFRVFYMKDNRIVGYESITSKIPNAVMVFNKYNGNPAITYEKMISRIKRLNADGYYLAHNHSTESAKPSPNDMELTRNFAANVDGFLGHIILGFSNRYSIIEENEKGLVLNPKEKFLNENEVKNMANKLNQNPIYNIKITNRDDLVYLIKNIQNEQDYSIAILTDCKTNVRMVLDIPNRIFNHDYENLNGYFKNLARNSGSTRVFIGTNDVKTYFKLVEHQRYGTIKDMVYIDNKNHRIKTEIIKKEQELFDNEKSYKKHRNRDTR